MRRSKTTPVILFLLHLAGGGGLAAQAAPGTGAPVTVQGSVRSRAELWDWFGREDAGEYGYLGTILRVGVGQQRPRFGWQIEGAAPVLLGLPADAVAPAPRGQLGLGAAYRAANGDENAASVFLKQAHVRLGVAPGTAGHGVRLGRFEFAEGTEVVPLDPTLAALKRDRVAHRLLGNFGWSHVGRSLDGAHYAYTAPRWNATAVVARTTRGVFDRDGWPGLDVGVGYAAATLRDREGSPGEARVFVLQYLDARDPDRVVKTDNRSPSARQSDRDDISLSTLGGHYARVVPTPLGPVDVLAWGAVQRGDWGLLEHRAWAGAAELGLQPGILDALRPWIRAGVFRSSGDTDPTDGVHETFFQVLPTPRIYSRTPFYNLMNLRDAFVTLSLRPTAALTIRADARTLALDSSADLWYAGGGAFEEDSFGYAGRPSGGSRDLATLLDLGLEYRVGGHLTTAVYAAHVGGGDTIESIYPDEDSAGLVYVEIEYRL